MRFPVTLLVEQQPEVRTPLATQLRGRGVQVIEATSADEACGLAEVGHVEVVIATQTFADQNGPDLGSRLRTTPGAAHLPLVLLSAGDTTGREGAAATASALVSDTCGLDELLDVLSRVVTARG